MQDLNSVYYSFFNSVASIYTERHMEGGNQALKIAPHPAEKCDLRGPRDQKNPRQSSGSPETEHRWLGDFYFNHSEAKQGGGGFLVNGVALSYPPPTSTCFSFITMNKTPRNSENCSKGTLGGGVKVQPARTFFLTPNSTKPTNWQRSKQLPTPHLTSPPFAFVFPSVLWP